MSNLEGKMDELKVDEGSPSETVGVNEGKTDSPAVGEAAPVASSTSEAKDDSAASAEPMPSEAPSAESKSVEAAVAPSSDWNEQQFGEENIPDVEIEGKTYKSLADGKYDAIIMSTGLKECVLAGLLAVRGLKVLQIDRNNYYGGACASLNLEELYKHFGKPFNKDEVESKFGSPRRYCVDLVPKLLMANGKLIKMLLQTGVTRYIDFNGVDGSYVLNTGKIYKVPVTPAEALKTSLVGFFQKRNLKNFAEFFSKWKAPDRSAERQINALSDEDFKAAITTYYTTHNPDKLGDIDGLMQTFQGRRPELVSALESKYGLPVFPTEEELTFGDGPLGLTIKNFPVGNGQGELKTLVKVSGFGVLADGSKGSAEQSGRISPGDILAKIGDESFIGKTDADVLTKLRSVGRPVTITFIKRSELSHAAQTAAQSSDTTDYRKVTMRQVYEKFGLDENSQNFIGHAMALQTDDKYLDQPAEPILEAVQLYGRSMGLYGQDSPYLYPLYGLSSLPEGFSRLAAIYGGTVMLRTDVDEILTDSEGKAVGVRSGERAASAKYIIGDASFFPAEKSRKTGQVVRSICLLKNPLKRTSGDSAQIILPAKHVKGKTHDLYISEIGAAHQVTTKGTYVAIASTTVETENPIAELQPAFDLMGEIAERFDSVTQIYEPLANGRRDNCFITKSLDATSHFESAAQDIMDIYQNIFKKPLDLTEKLVEDPNQQ